MTAELEHDKDLAAALVVALDGGLLSTADAVRVALFRGANATALAERITADYPYVGWPGELSQALWDLDEEVTCEHNHGGVREPTLIEAALRTLLAAARGKSAWRDALDRALS